MSELPLLLIVFWAALNPPASAASLASVEPLAEGRRDGLLAAAGGLAAVLLLLTAVLHGPLLDLLDVSAASVDIAAGIVMVAGAARPLLRGRAIEEAIAGAAGDGGRTVLAPLAVPLLATPAALVAAVSWGERAGEAQTAVVAVALVALTVLWLARGPQPRSRAGRAALDALARLTGALLAVLAVGLVVHGILAV
ncbi:MAG: hypothetical protein F4X76_02545 [Chloroflexi bacterium]|nr:hypothetical protein [Chloroflexota bacterium]